MNDVTIERAKKEKKEMEAKIFEAVSMFETSTELLVSEIRKETLTFVTKAKRTLTIECEVKL